MLRSITCLLLPLAMIAAPVAAQGISPADRTAIKQRIAAFDAMMKAGPTTDSLNFMPPRLLATIAKKAGVPSADVKASFAAQAAKAMQDVKFVSFAMALDTATAGVTPDKSRHYLLIPTQTVIDIPGTGRLLSKTTTLALKDLGTWYLVRIDGAGQSMMLREAYPEFSGVDFPAGSTTPIK